MPKTKTINEGFSAPAGFFPDAQDAAQIQYPEKPFIPPSQRKRSAPLPTIGALAKYRDVVEPWHAELASKAVATAAAELHETLALAESAKEAVTSIPAEQRAEEERVLAEAREAAAAGEPVEIVARTDWASEKAYREQRWAMAFDAAAQASRHYRSVVATVAPAEVSALVERAAKKRATALDRVRRARAEIESAMAATDAIFDADTSLGLTPPGWHRAPAAVADLAGKARKGLDDVLHWLEADDDVTSGRFVLDTSDVVPLHTRQALYEGSDFDRSYVLAQIELAEEYSVTSFTRQLADTVTPDEDFAEVHLRTKRLPS